MSDPAHVPDPDGFGAYLENVSPGLAELWLKKNDGNRAINESRVAAYARDMRDGKWLLAGDPVRFDSNGRLVDGQHRLLAITKSRVTIPLLVVRNVDPLTQTVIDTGAPRSFAHVLQIVRGEPNAGDLAAAVRWCWRYENGGLRREGTTATNSELLAWLDANPEVRSGLVVAKRVCTRVPLSHTITAGVYYEQSLINREDGDAFFELLRSGEALPAGSPILALRAYIERTSRMRDKPRPVHYAALTIKALNLWRNGREITHLHWRAGGASPEEFPKLDASL